MQAESLGKPSAGRCRCGANLEPVFFEPIMVRGEAFTRGHWYVADTCEQCEAKAKAAEEQAQLAQRLQAAVAASGIPPVFAEAKIEDLSGNLRQAADRWQRGEHSLVLIGACGTGKTFAACACLNARIRRTLRPCPFRSAPTLYRELRRASLANTDGELIENLTRAEALCLDDLGLGGGSDFALSALYEIADRLFVSGKHDFIITSNLGLDELSKRVDDRIVSRLVGTSRVIQIDGPDRRLKINA